MSRVIAFQFLAEAGDTDEHFVSIMECENTKQYPKNAGNTGHCRVSVVYPRDRMPDWEL